MNAINNIKKIMEMIKIISEALYIQKLSDEFPKWNLNVQKTFGLKRKKIIKRYINIINKALDKNDKHQIIIEAIETVRPELNEQLEYWNNKLKND